MTAAAAPHLQALDSLLAAGASTAVLDGKGRSALKHAVDGNAALAAKKIVIAMKAQGDDRLVDLLDHSGDRPLRSAVRIGNEHTVEILLRLGHAQIRPEDRDELDVLVRNNRPEAESIEGLFSGRISCIWECP